jgi:hypothetical protein
MEDDKNNVPAPIEKEPLAQSRRVKLFVTGLILEVLVPLPVLLGVDIPIELLQTIAGAIAALFFILIHALTQRNTAG